MIKTNNAKWDLSKEEKYFIRFLDESGFDGEISKQYISKTKFNVVKNGVSDSPELPHGVTNMKAFCTQYQKQFDMLCELIKLREEAAKK